MTVDKLPNAIEGIICENCGKQGLSEDDYRSQMMNPDRGWLCPVCGHGCEWDDDRYEQGLSKLEGDREAQEADAEVPQLFQLNLEHGQLGLIGMALQVLKASTTKNQLMRAMVAMLVTTAMDAVGQDQFHEDIHELLMQVNKLGGMKKCPDCGEYHG